MSQGMRLQHLDGVFWDAEQEEDLIQEEQEQAQFSKAKLDQDAEL